VPDTHVRTQHSSKIRHLAAAAAPSFLALLALLQGGLSSACTRRAEQEPPRADPATAQTAPSYSKSERDTALAKIDGVVITLGELEERINRQSPYVRGRYTSLEQKKEFLDNLIRFEVLAKEALRRGLDKDADVVRTMKQVMIQKLINQEFDGKITPDSIGDAELRAHYDGNLAEYVKAEEVRASAIVLDSRAQAERVLAEARGEAGKTNKGFRDLVAKYSADDDTKLRGGDLRYFTSDDKELPPEVVKAAFALPQVGEISEVIEAGGKFYVLKQTNRRKGATRSFEDAKPAIRNTLFRDKRSRAQSAFVEGLRSKAKIEIDETSLSKVRIEPPGAGDSPGSPAESSP
ncbi:MAG TPA: peptidyl-prolyl cis-trans isomerase, partial [Kofleriaceae bacterium]|nr:peptidyl-prolyl cis-trans isomerase [Kofleriaceae bacterium]